MTTMFSIEYRKRLQELFWNEIFFRLFILYCDLNKVSKSRTPRIILIQFTLYNVISFCRNYCKLIFNFLLNYSFYTKYMVSLIHFWIFLNFYRTLEKTEKSKKISVKIEILDRQHLNSIGWKKDNGEKEDGI